MKNFNIGVSNSTILNRINQINENENDDLKRIVLEYIETIKNSPILTLEFKTYGNLKGKHIVNDVLASRYIDNNIKQFEIYTINEIEKERNKIINIFKKNNISLGDDDIILNEAINNLIVNSISDYSEIDVNLLHESFEIILNHLKKPKLINENINSELNDNVIEIAVNLFNEKYELLENNDKELMNMLINYSYDEKTNLFEDIKRKTVNELNEKRTEILNERINKSIDKINSMNNSMDNIDDNIIILYNFKNNLIGEH